MPSKGFPVTLYLMVQYGHLCLVLLFRLSLHVLQVDPLIPFGPENLLVHKIETRHKNVLQAGSCGQHSALISYLRNPVIHWNLEVQVAQQVREKCHKDLRFK